LSDYTKGGSESKRKKTLHKDPSEKKKVTNATKGKGEGKEKIELLSKKGKRTTGDPLTLLPKKNNYYFGREKV